MSKRIGIIGFGAWGTALSTILAEQSDQLLVWDYDWENLEQALQRGENGKYLPGVKLPNLLRAVGDPGALVESVDIVILALRSSVFRQVVQNLPRRPVLFISVTKGIEYETGKTMTGILEELHPQAKAACLSGPTLALEVAQHVPTAAVAAGKEIEVAQIVQRLFHRRYFRIYATDDVTGVELGGALKNVMAIAAGICDGLGFGTNSKAALVTRALAEIRRLGTACGAKPETFSGLSGLGDLVVTCFSPLSRNRTLGERLGKGETLQKIQRSMIAVAEGVPTARAAYRLAREKQVETPIIDQVYAILYQGKPVVAALQELLERELKIED